MKEGAVGNKKQAIKIVSVTTGWLTYT